jgi:predicted metalloprotease with PDZ domain
MSRWTWVGLGTAALAAAVLALGPVGAKAADEAPGKSAETRRHVEVVRAMGGGGHLGVTLEDGEAPGAVVKDIQPDTPAAKAGLQPGDVIVRYQGDRVESAAALARMVRETPSGRHVEMDVRRAGSVQKLGATLEKGGGMHRWAEGIRDGALDNLDIELPEMPEMPDMPDMSAMPAVPPMPPIPPLPRDGEDVNAFRRLLRETGGARKLGIEYQELSSQLARYFKLGDERGVLVSEVDADGPAGKAGLQAGDVILKFNGAAVTDSRSLREQVRKAEAGSDATLTVSREGRSLDLKVKLGGSTPARRPARTT